MINFRRAALLAGLSAALVFNINTEFFQAETGIAVALAAEESSATSESGSDSDSAESGSATEATEASEATEVTTEASTEATDSGEASEETESSSASTESSTQGSTESSTQGSTETNTEKEEEKTESAEKPKKSVSSREEAEIKTTTVKEIADEIADEDAPDGSDKTGTFIPKIYNDTRLAMKNNKEYIAGYVYFNQGDSAWNQNGYCIAKAGCGPTSMAVVITSLTGEWVTPLDTAIWGYQHGYYSSAGSSHAMIPAMAAAYGIDCEGVGTDYQAIKKALKAGKPVVALMGPGYFTRGGHFMVLVAIDENDCVTVADVGSRTRSAYKYHLSDIIAQSKAASAGGPFWVMSYNEKTEKKTTKGKSIKSYTKKVVAEDFADVTCMNLEGNLPENLRESEEAKVTVKKVVSILTVSSGESAASSLENGIFSPVRKDTAVIREEDTAGQGSDEVTTISENRNPANVIKQDIATRQWERRISLSGLEQYLDGTIEVK